ncbi:MAG: hypothetical protein JEZ07_13425 [Phycisphaerae bacterium]|nr:hypothetical protein [Phycisphaerae bacterium]
MDIANYKMRDMTQLANDKLRISPINLLSLIIICCIFAAVSQTLKASADDYFKIQILDQATGRGVPLIELRTVNKICFWTDSQGIVAFNEPGLMGQDVFFHISGDGYEYPKDGFGYRGLKLRPLAGKNAVVKIKRINIAERLYRITGQGIYRDSLLTGHPVPIKHPTINALVTGQDTVIAVPYRNSIYWFWGDTDRVAYPLGNFSAAGATSELPTDGGLDPSFGIDLTYFEGDNGFSKAMVPLPGNSLRWIESLLPLRDEANQEKLYARVANVKNLGAVYDWHLMCFDDEAKVFKSVLKWDKHQCHDSAHPFLVNADGIDYYYLYPNFRVKASLVAISDWNQYEAWTCIAGNGLINSTNLKVDRDKSGQLIYSWKAGADRLAGSALEKLVDKSLLKNSERWNRVIDIQTGKPLLLQRGSVFWNTYRQCWIAIMSAKPGEVWFAQADSPVGPWGYARKILNHDQYNFYNPTQHPFFDQDNGRVIFFEGTYTASFSGAKVKTPRYDYNQIMYRLTLDDQRLALPVPVYNVKSRSGQNRLWMSSQIIADNAWGRVIDIAFFAVPPMSANDKLIPVYQRYQEGKQILTTDQTAAEILFYAVSASEVEEYNTASLMPIFKTSTDTSDPQVLCRVWKPTTSILSIDPVNPL